jgi:hypothetical protein
MEAVQSAGNGPRKFAARRRCWGRAGSALENFRPVRRGERLDGTWAGRVVSEFRRGLPGRSETPSQRRLELDTTASPARPMK